MRVTRAIDSFPVIPGDSRPFFSPLFLFFCGLARQPRRDSGVEIDLQIKDIDEYFCILCTYSSILQTGSIGIN